MNNKLLEHNVILSKYGDDIYVDVMEITSNYPHEKGKKEKVVRIVGNLDISFNVYPQELFLTQDSLEEMLKILKKVKNKWV